MASTIFKKYTPIFARTHRTARRNDMYSTINPFGSGDPNHIALPTPIPSPILKKPLNLTPINTPISATTYCTAKRNILYSRIISSLANSDLVVPVLEQWAPEVKGPELQHFVRYLHDEELFPHAVQVFKWVSSKGLPFSVGENYVQLDLIYRVHGLKAAESYFNNLNNEDKTQSVYHALLKCYFRECYKESFDEGLIDKCIAHLQKMMQLGFLDSDLWYNSLLSLYAYRRQFEKILVVLSDMKEKGVFPDDTTYKICIHAYGARSDVSSMELILKEMENQRRIHVHWTTYAIVVNVYIRAGLKEKALIYLKKCDEALHTSEYTPSQLFHYGKERGYLLPMEMYTITSRKQVDMGFVAKLGSLVKIGELEEAEKLFKEWEGVFIKGLLKCFLSGSHLDSRKTVPRSGKGLLEGVLSGSYLYILASR